MASKYTPLENFLRDLPATQKEVKLHFEEIQRILNSKLPSSAYEDRRWWDHETEGNHVNGRAWSNAGWKVASLDVDKKWVKLVRAATIGRGVQAHHCRYGGGVAPAAQSGADVVTVRAG